MFVLSNGNNTKNNTSKKTNIMNKVTTKQVQKLIAENNCKGSITCDYNNGIHSILFSESGKLEFVDSKTVAKVFRILKHELFFNQDFNFNSDEHDGIIQASQNGENPFAFSIICANTSLNGIFK